MMVSAIVRDPLSPPWLRLVEPLDDDVIRTGRLAVDVGALVVAVDDDRVHIPANELRLLVALALRLGRAVLYDDLVRMIWWEAFDPSDLGMRRVELHVLRVTASRLRRRLGGACSGLLVTLPDLGLRLERVPVGGASPSVRSAGGAPSLAALGRWARLHDRCLACGTTARRHWAHGLCEGCRPDHRPGRWHLLRGRKEGSG